MRKFEFTCMKYLVFTLICGSAIAISGCSGSTHLQQFFQDTVVTAIKDRGNRNKYYVKKFRDIGALSESQAAECMSTIDKKVQFYANDKDNYTKLMSNLLPAVSHFTYLAMGDVDELKCHDGSDAGAADITLKWRGKEYTMETGEGPSDKIRCSRGVGKDSKNATLSELHLSSFSAGNYVAASEYPSEDTGERHTVDVDSLGDVNPIQFFSDINKKNSPAHAINEAVHAQVYVLKPNIIEGKGTNSIDGVMELINQAMSQDVEEQVGMLNNYFIPAYEKEAGNKEECKEGGKEGEGKEADDKTYPIYLLDGEYALGGKADNIEDYNLIITDRPSSGASEKRLGYDMSVAQSFGEEVVDDMIRLRFTEFNEDALSKLTELTACDAYFLARDPNSGWKAYYMVYPIEVIKSMTDNNDGTVNIDTEPSGLGINLKTGKYVKFKGEEDGEWDYTSYTEVPNNENYYLALNSTQNNNTEGIAPLVLSGYETNCEIPQILPNSKHKSNPPKVTTARIILSDYLEGTFAPGFVDDETVVAFGRKIRLRMGVDYWHENDADQVDWYTSTGKEVKNNTQLTYSKKESDGVAYYVDKEGNKIETLEPLKITDFAHKSDLLQEPYTMKTIKPIEMKENSVIPSTGESKQTATNIGKEYTDGTILPTLMFPGKDIGTIDYENDDETKQRMYAIVTRFGLFDNALFSNWINSQSQTASLLWWNQYLSDNSLQYDVGQDHVLSYLEDNYSYEISQSGIVILDLDTISKIQKQYDNESNYERTSWIRTFFMMLGWFIVVYSSLLMLAWVIDANLDIGVKLLEKLTLGNWVAVKYEEDIPYKNTNDQTFLDSKKMFIRAAIMIAIGIFLINVNIFNVVLVLIDIFGRAATKIEEVINGSI